METYLVWFRQFLKSVGKGPDEFLEWARSQPDKNTVLDVIQDWVTAQKGHRFKTGLSKYNAVRSFLIHNRVQVPNDRSFRIPADVAPVDRHLTLDNLVELVGLAPQPYRSMLLVKWQGILDTECLIHISNHQAETIVRGLQTNAEIVKLTLPGRKRMRNIRPFSTFIGSDALTSLRDYFDRERGWPKPGEPIWVYRQDRKPVTKHGFAVTWLRLLRRARLVKEVGQRGSARYGFNVHNTRDIAISILNTVPGLKEKCIEFWAGHEVDPLRYNEFYNIKPAFVEEQYRLAMPYLNIISRAPITTESRQELDTLRNEVQDLKFAIRMLQDASGLQVTRPNPAGERYR